MDPHYSNLAEKRINHLVITGQSSGVGQGDPGRNFTTPGFESNKWFAYFPGPAGDLDKVVRVADCLHKEGNYAGSFILDGELKGISHGHYRFIASADQHTEADALGMGITLHHSTEGAALADEGD